MPFDNSARFADNTVLFASQLNRIIDNIAETAPAKATSVGDLLIGGGTNAIDRLGKGTANQFLRTTSDGATISWRGIGDSEITRDMIADNSINLEKINPSLYKGLTVNALARRRTTSATPALGQYVIYTTGGQRITNFDTIDFSTLTSISLHPTLYTPITGSVEQIDLTDAYARVESGSILCIGDLDNTNVIYFRVNQALTFGVGYTRFYMTYLSGSFSENSDIGITFFYDSKRITVLENSVDILSTEHGGTGRNHSSFVDLKAELQILNENVVNTPSIQANAITTPKITDLNITTQKLANLSVTTQKLANTSVTNTKIANNAIQTSQIQDGAITNAKLANDAINSAEIADLSIHREHLSTTSATYGFGSDVPNNGKLLGIDDGTDSTVGNRLVRYDIPSIAELNKEQVLDGFPGAGAEQDNVDDARTFGTVSGELLHNLATHLLREPILYVGTERYALHQIDDPGTSYVHNHAARTERSMHCEKITNQSDLRPDVGNATDGMKLCVWNNTLWGTTWTVRDTVGESTDLYNLRLINLPYNREFPWFMTDRGGYVNQFGSDFWNRRILTGAATNNTNNIALIDYKGSLYALLQTSNNLSNYYLIRINHNGFDSDGQPNVTVVSPSIPITQPPTSVLPNSHWQAINDATVWNDTVYAVTSLGYILKFTIPEQGTVIDTTLSGQFAPLRNGSRAIAATSGGGAYFIEQNSTTSNPRLIHAQNIENPGSDFRDIGTLPGYAGGTDREVKSLAAVYPHRYWLGMNQRFGWDMQ